ncbi:hypothetical protein HYDPIDRAFT_106378 [Hydnomerulius pinastri MD-312]|nr:hypothetical protein HYDPIDRAFT_106378 [Hydnomerulius pinastri MD-312]
MSEKKEPPKKKGKANNHRPETEDLPPQLPTTSRKRKADRTVDREPPVHVGHHVDHAQPMAREGRRSDLIPIPQHMMVRQRQRHAQTLLPPSGAPYPSRRMSVDMHHSRRPSMSDPTSRPPRSRRSSMPDPQRTMLQHAWHTVLNSDPLVDSDEERPDEHIRLDYNRRVQVINRLRGRPPTPEVEPTQATDVIAMDARSREGASRRRPSLA